MIKASLETITFLEKISNLKSQDAFGCSVWIDYGCSLCPTSSAFAHDYQTTPTDRM